jgi:hypothetical protein
MKWSRVREVDRPPAAAAVGDLPGLRLLWVGPVRQPALADAREQGVELGLAHRERVMLWLEQLSGVGEVERRAAGEPDLVEPAAGAHRARRRQPEHLREKRSGGALVA